VIDLSTLIALLTALAAATSSASPDLPGPATDPPSRTCSAPTTARPTPTLPEPSTSNRTGRPEPPPPTPTGRPQPTSTNEERETPRPRDDPSVNADSDATRSSRDRPRPTSPERSQLTNPDRSGPASSDPTGSTRTEESTRPRPTDPPEEESQVDTSENSEPQDSEPQDSEPQDSEPPNREPPNREPPNRDQRQERSTPVPNPRNPSCDRTAEPDAPSTTAARVPADLVELDDWYLTLPTGNAGDPDTVEVPQLIDYSSNYFQVNDAQDGVVFTAPVDGATTRNSSYPRSELREMDGRSEAAWSNGSGTHTLRATEAVTELPESKPEIVAAQIHGGDDDVMQIRLEGSHLMVQYADGAEQVMLDPEYRLGTPYDIEIVAANNSVQVAYNGEQKADLPLAGSTWYFKAGAYVQSNPEKGDTASAAGQVIIYSLEVTHR
jgi:Alginate lyase